MRAESGPGSDAPTPGFVSVTVTLRQSTAKQVDAVMLNLCRVRETHQRTLPPADWRVSRTLQSREKLRPRILKIGAGNREELTVRRLPRGHAEQSRSPSKASCAGVRPPRPT